MEPKKQRLKRNGKKDLEEKAVEEGKKNPLQERVQQTRTNLRFGSMAASV